MPAAAATAAAALGGAEAAMTEAMSGFFDMTIQSEYEEVSSCEKMIDTDEIPNKGTK
jgi:hypothetical protein